MGDSDEDQNLTDCNEDDQENEDEDDQQNEDEDDQQNEDEDDQQNEHIPQFGKFPYLCANIFDHDGVEPILNELMNAINDATTTKTYPPHLIKWYLDASRATLRRERIRASLKQIYSPPSSNHQVDEMIAHLQQQDSCCTARLQYPATQNAVYASEGDSNSDIPDECDQEKVDEVFARFSTQRQPCIPFYYIVRTLRYCSEYLQILYAAPFAVAASSGHQLHQLIHALILSGFGTFLVLPNEVDQYEISLYPMGMLVWHYLANRAGIIPDFDLDGVKKLLLEDEQQSTQPPHFSEHFDIPLLSNENGENRSGYDAIDYQALSQKSPLCAKMYYLIIQQRQADQLKQMYDENNEEYDGLGGFIASAMSSTSNNSTTSVNTEYNHTMHCYVLYRCVVASSCLNNLTVDDFALLLSSNQQYKANQTIFQEEKIKSWCLNQLLTAYGGIDQCKAAHYSFFDSFTNQDSGSNMRTTLFEQDKFMNTYSCCFVLEIANMLKNKFQSKSFVDVCNNNNMIVVETQSGNDCIGIEYADTASFIALESGEEEYP